MENQGGLSTTPLNRPWYHSPAFIFLVALTLRLAVITIGHTYRITPRGDHFQFGWEMGRIARSLAQNQGFSNPTDLPTGASAWAPPIYPYVLSKVFQLAGVYSNASGWIILAFNSIFGALTCVTIYKIGEKIYGTSLSRAASWTWAVFPYAIYWPVRVVWEASLSAYLLSLALLLTLRIAAAPPKMRTWIWYGALWGIIALTNTALISMLPFFLLWLLYRSPKRKQSFAGICMTGVVMVAIITPWLVRNYSAFGKFVFIRDNLPLEIHVANTETSNGLWTRSEHPGNDPDAMRRFQELGELRFMEEKRDQFHQFVSDHPQLFLNFTLKRATYFWIGTPVNGEIGGHNFLPARHLSFFLASALAFAGLWWTWRERKSGTFLFACLLIVYPLPYYLVNPFPRYKHPIEPEMILLIVFAIYKTFSLSFRQAA
jgi:4-amino-4-deoxy-L-arabinose transferase-like glycosyltransferase